MYDHSGTADGSYTQSDPHPDHWYGRRTLPQPLPVQSTVTVFRPLPAQPVFWQWQNTLSFLHAVHLRSHLRPARSYQHRTHNPAAHHDVSRCVCIHPTVSAATESDHTSDCIPVLRYCFHDVWSLPVHLLPSSCQNRYTSGSTTLYGHDKTRQDLHFRIFCTSFCSPPANICPVMRPFPYKKAERQLLSAQCRSA